MKWILIAALIMPVGFGALAAEAKPTVRVIANDNAPIQDSVKKIREDDEGLVILFTKAIGSFYLRRTVEEFDAYRKVLETSLKDKKPVSVTVDSQLNILEVK